MKPLGSSKTTSSQADDTTAVPAEDSLTHLLRTTLDASLNGIISMSAIRMQKEGEPGPIVDFVMNTANKAVLKTLFVQPELLIGRKLLTLFPGNIESGFFDLYARVAAGGEPEQLVQYYEDHFGLKAWFEVSAVNQGPDQVVITFNNVTEQKTIELRNIQKQEQLLIAIQELRRSNENLQEFAYVASHDLQEPLRKIQSFGQILKARYTKELDEDGISMIDKMESAAIRMSKLINDLLDFSRLSVKLLPLKPESLKEIVNEVLVILEQRIKEKNALIEVGNLDTVPADSFQIAQIFQNLLTNSLKFSKNNIQPHIQISSHREDIDIGTLPGHHQNFDVKKQYCVITVKDNGIGFDQNQAENIFKTFNRLHGKSHYPGSGIGLAIVKKVVENHKGYISAKGYPGEGSVFTIYLPL